MLQKIEDAHHDQRLPPSGLRHFSNQIHAPIEGVCSLWSGVHTMKSKSAKNEFHTAFNAGTARFAPVRTYSGKGVLATILSSVWSNELHALKSNTEVCSFELAAVGKYIEVGCTETE